METMEERDGRSASGEPAASGPAPRLYQRALDILAEQIARGRIGAGARLQESGVAAQFGISRAPARRALAELERLGLVEKADGRGYRVRGSDGAKAAAPAGAGPLDALRLRSRPSWERIYSEVEGEIAARTSFATWRVNEAELARHHRVSRTVARDVIARLQQRGVVRKDDSSRWVAAALTPDHVAELYELRWMLEPAALARAAPNLPPDLLPAVRRNLEAAIGDAERIEGATLDALEEDLHVTLLGHCRNRTLMQAIVQPQSLLIAHRFLYRWSPRLFATEPFLPEHMAVVERLEAGAVADAAAALERHLRVSADRAIARIGAVARQFTPDDLPYLERLG
jgi:DNA-binding GntR family transcriptional regulator